MYFILVDVGSKRVMRAYTVCEKQPGTDPTVSAPQASAPAPFPPVSWVCCREEGSLLSKQSLNGDSVALFLLWVIGSFWNAIL